ncbi:hypothetical protein BC826DRAFT_939829 [Russula brevipes]|nr:hypothetical protein BC826DRAFT_939829 [Russula brevipes]
MELLSVAQKYEMDHVLDHIRGSVALRDPPLIHKDNALNAYSLAQKYGLRQEVAQAARITLKSVLTIENLEGKLDVMPGDHLHELWRYHLRVQANLFSTIGVFKGSIGYSTIKDLNCAFLTSSGIPRWIDDYICSMTNTLSLFDRIEFQTALARHINAPPKLPRPGAHLAQIHHYRR